MKKQILGMVAASIMISGTAFADEPIMSKFKMSIGGFVKLDYVYNSTDLGSNAGMLAPASGLIPRTSTPAGNSDQSIFTARQSRLWFKVAGPELYGAKTNALIEADFYGDYASGNNQSTESPTMRMRLAYGTVDWTNTQILFGQFWDTFGPMVASTVDFRSGAGWGAPNTPRVPQVRITQKYNISDNNTISIALAAQNPTQNFVQTTGTGVVTGTPGQVFVSGGAVNGAGQLMFISKSLGVAPGYYGMAQNPLKVGIFGLLGQQSYNIYNTANQLFTTDKSYKSWGGGVYAFVPVLKSSDGKSRAGTASFEGQVYQGANMAYNTATAYGIIRTSEIFNTTPSLQTYGSAKGWGYAAQMIVYPTQELGVTFGTGKRQILNNESYRSMALSTTPLNDRTTGNYQYYVNLAYDFNAAIRLSAEYQYLRTNYATVFPLTTLDPTTGKHYSDFGQSNTFRVAAFYFF
jgi:hypothetical protein